MRKGNKLGELVQSFNMLNTMNGGMSEPQVMHHKYRDHHEVKVRIPGLSREEVKIEVHNNWLAIFHTLQLTTDHVTAEFPRIVFNKSLPYYIDVKRITANMEDDWLHVHLPFNEMADGYHKKIEISQ